MSEKKEKRDGRRKRETIGEREGTWREKQGQERDTGAVYKLALE